MLTIVVVQQGAWDIPVESMPLAAGYLKTVLDSDARLAGEVDVRICNLPGGMPLTEMARELFAEGAPDVLAFSVLGWNYRSFGCLAETHKQLRPDGVTVFGGNHVANQADRVFREFPHVDVVVNGEGEHTFQELVHRILEQGTSRDFSTVAEVSFRDDVGAVVTTGKRERIPDLDVIPSPFLSGTIPMLDHAGRFRYDVALMETNRGCPYKCSFCYWGGAVGQRVRSFSRERLAAELDYFGFHQVPTVVLCDANFGLLEADEHFVEDLIKTRERYGFPKALESSWAKNKSARFYRIVKDLKNHGFKSSFTLALQTLSDEALTGMRRKNMRVNQWEELADWLTEEGLDSYAELIWGAPGETPESFLAGYDRLASKVSRVAVYPMLLLPNTGYVEEREVHEFVTVRGEFDDFEYVLANRSSTLAENLDMQRFVFWARILGENSYLRHVWRPVRELAGMSHSELIRSLMDTFEESTDPAAAALREMVPVVAESPAVIAALRRLHSDRRLDELVRTWWRSVVVPRFPAAWQDFAVELYEYERWCRGVYVAPGEQPRPGWRLETIDGEAYYVSAEVNFSHDVKSVLARWQEACAAPPVRSPVAYRFHGRVGFYENLDNHELGAQFAAFARGPESMIA
jgi:radical SAM superfamily enzyme YgiQ (UPF0313 family)